MNAPSGQVQTPPFLTKLFQLVNDPATSELVSWTDEAGHSFTVHKPSDFGRDVLPKYFKHNNFSSFVRQLNQYGFHKQNPDRWMFGHDNFRRGRADLLRNITRRRPKAQTPAPSSQAIISPGTALAHKAVVELGNYGIEGEVKSLKRDKDLLIKELVVTRQAEEKLKNKCENLETRMQGLENTSKQMQAFIMNYFSQVLQPYSEAMASRKRKRLPSTSGSDMIDVVGEAAAPPRPTAQPVTHPAQPPPGMDALRVMMQQMQMNMNRSPSQPHMRAAQSGPPPPLVEAPDDPRSPPKLTFAPATVQELHEELPPASSAMHINSPITFSPRGSLGQNGGISVRELGEAAIEPQDGDADEVLGFFEDMPTTPNSSLTMDAIESALKDAVGKANGHLDTPDFSSKEFGKNFADSNGGLPLTPRASPNCSPSCSGDEKAIEEFLELDIDGTQLPPPLTHLPEGTDIHALAKRIEGFKEQAENM